MAPPTPAQPKLRLAITGGGLAGASLLLALQPFPHLDVHIFDSAPSFSEPGAAIGLAKNATEALRLLHPSGLQCLSRAHAVPQQSVRFMLATGPDAGAQIDKVEAKGESLTAIVQRADLLRELLREVPRERMHRGKKVVGIEYDETKEEEGEKKGKGVRVKFEDRSEHKCDVLIGADRIHSRVRG